MTSSSSLRLLAGQRALQLLRSRQQQQLLGSSWVLARHYSEGSDGGEKEKESLMSKLWGYVD